MKKTLIALAVMGAAAGVAHAQSNVTLYGVVDTGLVKETGSDWRMGGNVDSRIGFRGVEDLGSGMKATFELERRFNLNDGTQAHSAVMEPQEQEWEKDDLVNRSNWNYSDAIAGRSADWIGAANVGLKGDAWGAVRLGRVNNLSVETFRMLDPFNQYGVGASLAKSNILRSEQISNTVRYDSPSWNGFGFGATYTLGQNTKGADNPFAVMGNDGFAINLKYDNGPLLLLANYDRVADSNDSYVWNVGGAYTWQGFRVSLGYQDSRFKVLEADNVESGMSFKEKAWIVGLQYKTGPHTFNASYNYGKASGILLEDTADAKAKKYALGYTYNLSKRTSVYANVAYTDNNNTVDSWYYNGNLDARDSMTGVQFGLTHKF